MFQKYLSFALAASLAMLVQVAAIFTYKMTYFGMDCGLLEERICTFPVFLDGVTQIVASINLYTLGIPTIAIALIFGSVWRMYRTLRESGMRRRDLLKSL